MHLTRKPTFDVYRHYSGIWVVNSIPYSVVLNLNLFLFRFNKHLKCTIANHLVTLTINRRGKYDEIDFNIDCPMPDLKGPGVRLCPPQYFSAGGTGISYHGPTYIRVLSWHKKALNLSPHPCPPVSLPIWFDTSLSCCVESALLSKLV